MSGATFAVADAEALPFEAGAFDVVVSNSVLHWLHDPELGRTPAKAVAELARVLRPGGWLALSVAATGTARRFQRAYHGVLAELAADGVALGRVRRDPIGTMALHEVVEPCLAAGLDVVSASLSFEPVRYPDPAGYAADVAAYGRGVYLAPVPPARHDQAWDRVAAAFAAAEGPGPYLHDQYMSYVIARR
ncbi:MAG: SAM-dependent methyltransferase [Deltaproteobacteria bacterium]|nr:MAG: SAM-dependent methyltransferase [Deltaproteobacteria bacterium]